MIVSGAIDGPTLRQAAGARFVSAPRRTLEARTLLAPGQSSSGTTRIPADIDEPVLLVTWPLPPVSSRDYRMLAMVWPSIPYRLEEFGWTYGWGHTGSAVILGGPRAPVLAVSITLTSASKLGDATDALDKAVAFAKRAVGTEKATRIWEATWQAQAQQMLSRWESLETRNELVADLLDQGADSKLTVGRVDELANATPDDVHAVADRWLAPPQAHYVLLEPSGVPGKIAVIGYEGAAETQGVRVDPALADHPLAVPTTRLALDIDHYQLANGLTLALWPGGTSPLVHGRLVIASGAASDPDGKEGEASLAGATDVDMDSLSFSEQALSTRIDDSRRQPARRAAPSRLRPDRQGQELPARPSPAEGRAGVRQLRARADGLGVWRGASVRAPRDDRGQHRSDHARLRDRVGPHPRHAQQRGARRDRAVRSRPGREVRQLRCRPGVARRSGARDHRAGDANAGTTLHSRRAREAEPDAAHRRRVPRWSWRRRIVREEDRARGRARCAARVASRSCADVRVRRGLHAARRRRPVDDLRRGRRLARRRGRDRGREDS